MTEQLSNDDDDRISRYLDNEMTQEERAAFEKELANNEILRNAYTFEKKLQNVGRSAANKIEEYFITEKKSVDDDIIRMIGSARQGWEKENATDTRYLSGTDSRSKPESRHSPESAVSIHFQMWKTVVAAASVIIIISISVIWFSAESNKNEVVINNGRDTLKNKNIPDTSLIHRESPNKNLAEKNDNPKIISPGKYQSDKIKRTTLYAKNFRPDNIPDEAGVQLQEPLQEYKAGNYENAIAALDEVNPELTSRGSLYEKKLLIFHTHYYKALSYMATNACERAIPELEKAVLNSPDILSKSKANWYLALAHLNVGDVEKADSLLNTISADGKAGEYKNRALALKKQIN